MEEKDYIEELFSKKLANHEVNVKPELWSSISSQLASNTAISSGLSSSMKWFIGIGFVTVITVTSLLFINSGEAEKQIPSKKDDHIVVSSNENEIHQGDSTFYLQNSESQKEHQLSYQSHRPMSMKLEDEDLNNNKNFAENNFISANSPKIEDQPIKEKKIEDQPIKTSGNKPFSEKSIDSENNPVPEKINDIEEKPNVFIGDLPNIFTPNNDSENDLFFIQIKGLTDFSITILNKDNQRVFSSTDPNFKWDGKDFQNNLVPVGSYIYFFTGTDSNGKPVSRYSKLEVNYY